MKTSTTPRVMCPKCGHLITVKLDGQLRTHGATAEMLAAGKSFCHGSRVFVASPRVSDTVPKPRGICRGCGTEYAIRADGRIPTHHRDRQPPCAGAEQLPQDAS